MKSREERLAYARDYYVANREQCKARDKAYYRAHREAMIESKRRWRQAHLDEVAERSKSYRLEQKYSLSVEEYDALLAAQGVVCAICGQPETARHRGKVRALAVDHDHNTGQVRGLLCSACNKAVERVDTVPDWSRRVARYLRKARNGTSANASKERVR